jgi:hypothetical protein
MNLDRLHQFEKQFYLQYPNGWNDEELADILRKHQVSKVQEFAREALSKETLQHPNQAIEMIVKLISKASVVSVFEKVQFRNLIKESDAIFIQDVVDAIEEMLHQNQATGFDRLVGLLSPYKLAKWPIITAFLFYQNPTYEVFIKPTTVKAIIKQLELEDLHYSPKVNYPFYQKYREQFHVLSQHVNKELSITTGHFSGFLMMQTT